MFVAVAGTNPVAFIVPPFVTATQATAVVVDLTNCPTFAPALSVNVVPAAPEYVIHVVVPAIIADVSVRVTVLVVEHPALLVFSPIGVRDSFAGRRDHCRLGPCSVARAIPSLRTGQTSAAI